MTTTTRKIKSTYTLKLSTIIKTVAGYEKQEELKDVHNTQALPSFSSEMLPKTMPILEAALSQRFFNEKNAEYIDGAIVRKNIEKIFDMSDDALSVMDTKEIHVLLDLHRSILPVPYYFTSGNGTLEKGFYTDIHGSLLLDSLIDPMELFEIETDHAYFNRKACDVNDVRKGKYKEYDRYAVLETITLDLKSFLELGNDLLADRTFLENRGGTWTTATDLPDVSFFELTEEQRQQFRNGAFRACVKVQCYHTKYAFLIDPQGYNYARYTAIIENN